MSRPTASFRTPSRRSPQRRSLLRRSLLRRSLWAAAAVLTLLAAAPSADACSCAPPGTPRAELKHADAVFTGRVVAVEAEDEEPGFRRLAVRFALDAAWKGVPAGDEVTVKTAEQSAACGYFFEPEEEYLVYAYADDAGGLTTGLCARNAPLAEADEDLAALGEPARTVGKDDAPGR